MALQPFQWSMGGQKITSPEQAARQRQIAESLIGQASSPAQNWTQGLADVAAAFTGTQLQNQAAAAEEAGRLTAAQALAGIGPNADFSTISAALANPWLSGPQATVASALLQQNLERQDPRYQLGLERDQLALQMAQAEYDQMMNPPTTTYDPNAPEAFQLWQLQNANPGFVPPADGSLVTVNTGENSGAFTKKSDELAAARFDTMVGEGNTAQNMMGDINTLAAIGSQINTGKTAEVMNVLGPYAEALGVEIAGLGEGQAFQSIVDRMAPAMRPAGSGSASDTDVKMFLNSLPSLGKNEEGNRIIMETLSAVQQQKIAAAEIAAQAQQGLLTWQEADAQIRGLGDPYARFNEYRRRTGIDAQNGQVIDAGNGITIKRIGD